MSWIQLPVCLFGGWKGSCFGSGLECPLLGIWWLHQPKPGFNKNYYFLRKFRRLLQNSYSVKSHLRHNPPISKQWPSPIKPLSLAVYVCNVPRAYHVPQDGVLQSSISDNQVECVSPRRRVKLRLPFRWIKLKPICALSVWLSDKHDFLASLVVMQANKCLGTSRKITWLV